ncbi:MBL fold metallo-hydrolase [Rodentibacter trehalosifermentans]|uniref:MBL fold metallo-hydrolase n=1 Tax=Rodentibacter trehalosifermentans TaxID=1908263 RepID=UPI000984DC25|nr:MBL fold metallo-hydrolase [Rodentibacter trehalosifermentans]
MQFCERRSVKPEEEVGALLKAKGFDPLAVKSVVMTHMHGDHAGGIPNFPNSEFVLSEAEFDAVQAKDAVFNGYLKMHYPDFFFLNIRTVKYEDGVFENFAQSTTLTADGKIRLVPTANPGAYTWTSIRGGGYGRPLCSHRWRCFI